MAKSVLVLLFGTVVLLVLSRAEDAAGKPVIYLIGDLNGDFRNSRLRSNSIPKEGEEDLGGEGILLQDPIPEDEALEDGVYFRPADGKPLDHPEVSTDCYINHQN